MDRAPKGLHLSFQARLSVFPDCHLLGRQGDPVDIGSPDDLELIEEEGEGGGECEGEGEGGVGVVEEGEGSRAQDQREGRVAAGSGDNTNAESAELQAAIAASLAAVYTPGGDDEEELRVAIAMSLQHG